MTKVTNEILGVVYSFAETMVELLRTHDDKQPWRQSSVSYDYLFDKLNQHAANLHGVLDHVQTKGTIREVWRAAANVANYAMILADKYEQEAKQN